MSGDNGSFEAEVRALLANGQKIEAIKLYRERTGAGLAEAKEAVEAFEREDSSEKSESSESDLEREILPLLKGGKKIEAIKLYRERTGLGLKEAKDAVEAIVAERQIVVSSRSGCLGVVVFLFAIALGWFAWWETCV